MAPRELSDEHLLFFLKTVLEIGLFSILHNHELHHLPNASQKSCTFNHQISIQTLLHHLQNILQILWLHGHTLLLTTYYKTRIVLSPKLIIVHTCCYSITRIVSLSMHYVCNRIGAHWCQLLVPLVATPTV